MYNILREKEREKSKYKIIRKIILINNTIKF